MGPPYGRLPILFPYHSHFRILMGVVLLMDEILHQLIGTLSHYLQGFLHPRWLFGISSINSMGIVWGVLGVPQINLRLHFLSS